VVLAAVEHQVLEEVSESTTPLRLVLTADVVPDLDVRNRKAVVFMKQDLQTVVETVLGEVDLWQTFVSHGISRSYDEGSQYRTEQQIGRKGASNHRCSLVSRGCGPDLADEAGTLISDATAYHGGLCRSKTNDRW
jgi:hypothetical protein